MNKYVKAVFCVPYAGIKYLITKIKNGKAFRAKFPAIMSPLTELTIEKGTDFSVGKKLKMHNGAKIRVRNGAKVSIGDNFSMSNGCVVTAYENVCIGNDVMLGPNVFIYDQDHDYSAGGGVKAMQFKTAPVEIGNNVWIAANAIILRGTKIGDNVVISAGSIVKGVVPSNTVFVQKRIDSLIKY